MLGARGEKLTRAWIPGNSFLFEQGIDEVPGRERTQVVDLLADAIDRVGADRVAGFIPSGTYADLDF